MCIDLDRKTPSRWRFRAALVRVLLTLPAVLALLLLPGSPAAAFDTGPHYDLTHDALEKEGFQLTAIQVVQVENWLTDWYSSSPVSPYKHDLEKMHFDNLTESHKVRNSWAWMTVNTRSAIQQAARENNPIRLLTLMGVSLHAVQDFYSHSNWTAVVPAGQIKTWFDAPELWNDSRVRTGGYPGDNLPENQRHGDYTNQGINKDSYVRPGWTRAYITAYVACRQWVSVMRQWVNEVNPSAWTAAQSFTLTGQDATGLKQDLEAAYRISEWIALAGQDGHWKGPGSGSLADFTPFTAKWMGSGDSKCVREFKTRSWAPLLTGLPGDNAPAGAIPAVPRSAVNDRAVVVRTLKAEEIPGAAFDPLDKPDFVAKITVGDQLFTEGMQMNRSGISPVWTTIKFVPASQPTVPIKYELWDEDAGSSRAELADIHPATGKQNLDFVFNRGTRACSGDVSGVHDSAGSAVTQTGAEGKRASVRFFVTEHAIAGSPDYANPLGNYVITVNTGDVANAGTDANVYVRIQGGAVDTGPIHLNPLISGNAFERGRQDVVRVAAMEVGKIYAVTVWHDNSYAAAGWFLSSIRVQTGNQDVSASPNQWFEGGEAQNQKYLAVQPYAPDPNAPVEYTVTISTGDVSGAGTDANVYIKIHGAATDTGPIHLNPLIRGNAFERNQRDVVSVKAKNVGKIYAVTVWHDDKFAGSAWYLGSIQIQAGGQDVTATCNQWFEGSEAKNRKYLSVR